MKYTLTKFEVAMMRVLHCFGNFSTKPVREEPVCEEIQQLKNMALEECVCRHPNPLLHVDRQGCVAEVTGTD